jgi:DNA-binding MarR family transcriptional regulator
MPLTVVRRESEHLYSALPKTAEGRDAVDALLRLLRTEEQQIEAARISTGLTKSEFSAVRYMLQADRDGRPMGPKDLAVMLATSNASITKIVDSLGEKGLLERTPHPTDRRAQVLKPTARAAAVIDDAYARFHQAVVGVVDGLTPADNLVLARCASTIVGALADENAPADEYVVADTHATAGAAH